MGLLLVDLDDTLIERGAAFRRWATGYATAHGFHDSQADWLVAADKSGHEPRERLAAMIRERFGLEDVAEADLVEELQLGLVEHIELDLAVPKALDEASAAGWVTVVVTNGTVRQQERKLRRTGLAGHVEGWVISEGAGIRKPDPAIFELAARQVGRTLDGAWMIGDSPEADIGGAYRAGLSSVWLHRGRTWATADFAPTRIADSCPQAVAAVVAGRG